MSLKQFLTSKVFVKHLLTSFGVTLGLIFFVLLVLRIYTRHGQAYPVPDVFGMTEEKFAEVLRHAHLQYKITDSTYNPEIQPGGVVGQVPEAGHKVKRNRMVYLTINTLAPVQVALPKVNDISYRQAVAQLELAGLLPGKIIYEPSEFQNLVLGARIKGKKVAEGEKVPRGTIVDLVLGSGENNGTSILPDLRGVPLAEAIIMLTNNSLNIGSVFYDQTVVSSTDSTEAVIFRQHPSPDFSFQITAGSEVDVWLTTDKSKLRKEKDKNQEDADFF